MDKEQFLARCGNAYDMGLCSPERLKLMERWLDFVMRFEGGQMSLVADFLMAEKRRCNAPGPGMAIGRLAGDDDGYALCHLAAILTHPCQACAVDSGAWHTREAFCDHKGKE
jgi:hypothetical protein